jgi:diguanylate cyclase (GGDEF)-like protein/PAS domain S-box-containing protein
MISDQPSALRAARLGLLLDDAPCALVTVDEGGRIVLVNARAERLFGYGRHELIGRAVDQLLLPDGGTEPWYREAASDIELELGARRRDGSEFPVAISLSRTEHLDECLTSVAVRDLTERELAAETLAHQASHDPLTGLPNRSLFLDRLEHALARIRRSRGPLAVLFLDLDRFKLVNDTRGHDVGDLLLRALAPRLSAALRPGDTIARFGGDEFVVLCEDLADEDAAVRIAQRLTAACSHPLVIGDQEHVVTVSAGIALVREGQEASASELLKNADAAMYSAKASDTDHIEVFDDGMGSKLLERIGIECDLRRALVRDELRLLFQPVMSLRGEAIVGVEALLRWQHPTRGLLEPSEFMGVAESSGLIVPIGSWVIREACRQAAAWQAAAPEQQPIYVSVNLSRQQVVRSDVANTVARSLRASGLDPALLELEITEGILLDDVGACALALRGLKALGVRVVLDDFGTGYFSLRYLKRLRIDALKIDPSFVDGLGRDPEDVAVVDAVLSLARALELRVTAEGVETTAQLSRLREQGCDFAQGYLFSRPGTADEVLELLLAGAGGRE